MADLDDYNLGLAIAAVEQLIVGLSTEELSGVAATCARHEG